MENASKALIIAGAILLSILIIAIGMYIYTSSHNSISEAGSQISEQEKTSFNQQWNTYEGAQGGNNIKALLQKVIGNCNTNAQEEQRLVDVVCSRPKNTGFSQKNINIGVDNIEDSIQELTTLRNFIEPRHTYYVQLEYDPKTSLVNKIIIRYEESDVINDVQSGRTVLEKNSLLERLNGRYV